MRIPYETIHRDTETIEFSILDDVMNKRARKLVDLSTFFTAPPTYRDKIRENYNRELNEILDREAKELNGSKKLINLEDKVTSEAAWRAMILHEGVAEVPPVPTFREVINHVCKKKTWVVPISDLDYLDEDFRVFKSSLGLD